MYEIAYQVRLKIWKGQDAWFLDYDSPSVGVNIATFDSFEAAKERLDSIVAGMSPPHMEETLRGTTSKIDKAQE